jgi:DNA-binding NarL/FixJ family response regulator
MRREVEAFLPAVLQIEALHTQLSAALAVDNDPAGLDRRLIYVMADRVEELERKVAQLSQAPAVQSGAVRKQVKELANAGHSTRAIAKIVGCSKSTVSNYLDTRKG